MTRIFACKGPDATMEIYVPQSLVLKRNIETAGLGGTVNGLYALDLADAQKGKVIEPVRLRSTKDNKAIVLDQFTRKGLKPATIPIAGGTLEMGGVPLGDARLIRDGVLHSIAGIDFSRLPG